MNFIISLCVLITSLNARAMQEQGLRPGMQVLPKHEVRNQILANLKYLSMESHAPERLYEKAVFCIGTGRKLRALAGQARKTVVGAQDIAVDVARRVDPDYCCDGWQPWKINTQFSEGSFGFIFFARVGYHPPLNNPDELKQALGYYRKILSHDGIFIYNSELFIHEEDLLQLAKQCGYDSIESWQESWRDIFFQVGFNTVNVVLKKEDKGVSLLLIAQ